MQIEDRTETRRAEQLRSDFIANASHELRTPLASIIGYIETLQNHARNDPEARERFLGIMAREAGRMQRLVDDLMSLSRIEMTEHLRPVEAWSLNQIAAESAAALLPVARQQGSALEIEPRAARRAGARRPRPARPGLHQPDRQRDEVRRRRRHGAGAARRRRAGRTPTGYGVTVEDTGPGIPREHIHRLTERFYRVSVASSRNKGGTGLGLAIVKHILNRHEGRLEIVSDPRQGQRLHGLAAAPRGVADEPPPPRRIRRLRRISVPPERRSAVTKMSLNRRKAVFTAAVVCLTMPRRSGATRRRGKAEEQDDGMAHIVSAFDEDLVQVQAKISEMGGICEELLSKALESVQSRDAALAREVIERDQRRSTPWRWRSRTPS